ncbi:unnamed protein product [Leptidea sinapis]|uniref:Uncharacterized protein n=1 Tax=Leptidea sinapis TaxID=189913 RepID=A0A5E4QQL2_9NEOP|nr:unnamed protein product [Leptidea sinapis]
MTKRQGKVLELSSELVGGIANFHYFVIFECRVVGRGTVFVVVEGGACSAVRTVKPLLIPYYGDKLENPRVTLVALVRKYCLVTVELIVQGGMLVRTPDVNVVREKHCILAGVPNRTNLAVSLPRRLIAPGLALRQQTHTHDDLRLSTAARCRNDRMSRRSTPIGGPATESPDNTTTSQIATFHRCLHVLSTTMIDFTTILNIFLYLLKIDMNKIN